jgi:hypothetical protein
MPNQIADRTSFLLDESKINPAHKIFEIIKKFETMGTNIV